MREVETDKVKRRKLEEHAEMTHGTSVDDISTTYHALLGPAAVAGEAAVRDDAAGEAAGGSYLLDVGGTCEAAAFELPPELEYDEYDTVQHFQQAECEEDVFGHGDDLGLAAYHHEEG